MKVLLVDDEQKFALMLSKRLELRGIPTQVFFSGEKALAEVEAGNRFDVAVLDVKMPGIGGVELKRRLSTVDPEMKFVFLTGHGSGTDYETGCLTAGECLPKPLKIEQLIETLNRLLPDA
ncbi:response regulator [Desulfosarcina widdelii]|uniref:Response regulator n=1 Tax=Desulfosarcina widdelii TaxID=947919 RepID=A0A5K7Z1Z6_9BACT|nr:response regulator [Desulfosarcina widdelii]BBO74269.1 response regulator [Desulfosarcina widdelii]